MPDKQSDIMSVIRPGHATSVETADGLGFNYYITDDEAKRRIKAYREFDQLLEVDEHARLFQVMDEDTKAAYIPVDLPGMLTRLMRHYVVSPAFKIEALEVETQPEIERIMENSDFITLLREVSESLPALGDAVLRVDLVEAGDVGADDTDKLHALVRYVKPHYFHPVIDPLDSRRMTGATLAWTFQVKEFEGFSDEDQRQVVLREVFEKNEDGDVTSTMLLNWWDGSRLGEPLDPSDLFEDVDGEPVNLGIDEIPVVFIANNRKAGEFWGRSEFPRVKPIIRALENRLAQLDEVLEKHARPKLIVPPGTLQDSTDGTGAAILSRHFDVIEVESSLMDKAIKPEYLTWDMQIEAIKHQIEKLEEYFFMVTETSPASFGLERDGSQVESARALRFKAHRTVNKVEDKRDPIGDAVRKVLRVAQKLELTSEGKHDYTRSAVKIVWGDPIVEDTTQRATDFSALKAQGLVSVHRAVRELFGLNDGEAEIERTRILVDEAEFAEATAPAAGTGLLPGDGLLGAEAAGAPQVETPAAEAAEEAREAAEVPEETAKKEVVLNGAQVTALVGLVQSVSSGELQRESAVRIIVAAFGLDETQANEILADAGRGFVPSTPGAPAPPTPGEAVPEGRAPGTRV